MLKNDIIFKAHLEMRMANGEKKRAEEGME
jgi:hypothetical protein